MTTANDIKRNIIYLIRQINDMDTLKLIYTNVATTSNTPKIPKSPKAAPRLDFKNATIKIRTGISFDTLLKEQSYKPISYQKFRAMADEIKWEHSLDELLAALD